MKSVQEYVLDKNSYDKFMTIHPDTHQFIWDCPYLNVKIKIMMWALSNRLQFIAEMFLFARYIKLKFLVILTNAYKCLELVD